jgi:hypothetical protein
MQLLKSHIILALCLSGGCLAALPLSPTVSGQTPDSTATMAATDSIAAATDSVALPDTAAHKYVRKVLFLGDSMTGWMGERLNAYGDINGFEVATVVWDGSTIAKWASTRTLGKLIEEQAPDAILVCLGMNDMFEQRPETRLKNKTETLIDAFGDTPFLWIGPPSWPGHSEGEAFNAWMESELGDRRYFKSFDLPLPRQSKSNPHPTRAGIESWMDEVVEWIPGNSDLDFESLTPPPPGKVSRGKTFIYKRMKEQL